MACLPPMVSLVAELDQEISGNSFESLLLLIREVIPPVSDDSLAVEAAPALLSGIATRAKSER